MNNQKSRNIGVDYLRVIGLFLIILAHCIQTNTLLFQIRCFDVPLMVFVSALTFSLNFKVISYSNYLKQRVLRLIIPLYFFLFCFFSLSFIYSEITETTFLYQGKVIGTLLLQNGKNSIGYVWIIKVFLLMALITPMINQTLKKVNHKASIILCFTILLIYLVTIKFLPTTHQFLETLYYLVGYGIVATFAIISAQKNTKTLFLLVLLSTTVFISSWILANNLISFSPQLHKYPPSSYFLTYGITCSIVLHLISKYLFTKEITVITWISSNSLWIYFWHIVMIQFTQHLDSYIQYPIVIIISSSAVFIQNKIKHTLLNTKMNVVWKKLIKYSL